jgi:hypothetical protein
MTNPNAPILSSRYMANAPNCSFTWTGEIVAAAVDGSNTVWRFAHNHNGGCYYGEGFAQISNDGNWALFSSYWDGQLGADTGNTFGCTTRIDTFIVELVPTPPDPPAPLTLTTTSLQNATQNAAYSATLSATGGVPPYTRSITTGRLPSELILDPNSGTISRIPRGNGGSSQFTVLVLDGHHNQPR